MKRVISALVVLSVAVISAGCYSTTLRSGRPPDANTAVALDGPTVEKFEDKWHHGFVNGVAEVDGNYNLAHICPNGWAEIKTETSFLNGLVGFATSLVYTPQSISVRCAATNTAAEPTAPPASAPAPEQPAEEQVETLL